MRTSNLFFYLPFYLLILTFLLTSCGDTRVPRFAPEYLYDAPGQQVIKSVINNKKQTIAILYGNELAAQMAGDSMLIPRNGSVYTMVTWKQKPMPQWYGTNMNAEIYSAEIVKVSEKNQKGFTFDYEFRPGQGFVESDRWPDKEQRIRFIVSQRAAVFP